MVLDKSLNQISHMSFLKGHLTDFEITRTRGYSPATDRLYSLFEGNPWKDQRLTQVGISFSTNSGFLDNFCLISAVVKDKNVSWEGCSRRNILTRAINAVKAWHLIFMDLVTSWRRSIVELMSENTLSQSIRIVFNDLHILKIIILVLSEALHLLFTVYELTVGCSVQVLWSSYTGCNFHHTTYKQGGLTQRLSK